MPEFSTELASAPGKATLSDSVRVDLVELIHQPTWKSILLDLVKTNKMDPWAIDIADLAERYLRKINALQEQSLRIPANAILCSAILLKYKSKTLRVSSIEEEEDDLSQLTEERLRERQKLYLAEGIPELIAPRLVREGKVSLDDLVACIESVLEKTRRKKFLAERKALEFRIPFAQENIEERMRAVFEEIQKLADEEGLVLFSALVKDKTVIQMINIFIALLFLCNDEKIGLVQDEFFSEIFISLQKT